MKQISIHLLLLLMLVPFVISCAEKSSQEPSYWDIIKKKFEEAKSDDKELSDTAKEWIEEDIKKIGDWEYKVLRMKYEGTVKLEQTLNELGNERWECFWVEKKDETFILMFKRPVLSYLQRIPKGELFKMLNSAQGE